MIIRRVLTTAAALTVLLAGMPGVASAGKPTRTLHCYAPGTIKHVKAVAYWYDGVFKGYVNPVLWYQEVRLGVPHAHLVWLDCR